ncbi:TRAP transporter permease [Thorsellia kenyensis]|uniref:TRAP transporter permease n=1 Tax=Thorsellia kenyensis TaxID=1549888 RepID=A0ABV6C6F8_9GAMM
MIDENQTVKRLDDKILTKCIFWIALIFAIFQIITAAYHPVSSQVLRSMHVGFLLLIVFMSYPFITNSPDKKPNLIMGIILGSLGLATGLYQWVFEADLIQRSGELTPLDWYMGILVTILIFEAARRVMGLALPIVCGVFLLYALFGHLLPGDFAHRGYDLDQIINQLAFGTEGFYGSPTYVSATYIFLFILFGAFLEQAGMTKLFTDFAMGLVGHKLGGPAKVSVFSSLLMGTITGSGVANVVTTGQFTIPLMKRFGYKPAFAGGVEATSSMGSQMVPPVMGAVAFIMAETINVPYIEIAKAALIPALLYFGSVFWMVHLVAKADNLSGLPKEDCPNPWKAIKERWYLLIPLFILIYLLFSGRTPMYAGTAGLALTVIVILGSAIVLKVSQTSLRVAFWVCLALITSALFKYGISVAFIVIFGLIGGCLFIKGAKETLKVCVNALVEGSKHAVPVGIACGLVGVIIGVVSLTGVAPTFAGAILSIGENNLLLSLVLTMITCLVLGMGIPTIPNYIITSSIAAPALLSLGIPLIVSHMFVFYFGILADLTPPVALACFAAAPIAKESGLKISLWAVKIAVAGFIVPFMAVYSPALMLQGDASLLETAYVTIKAILAMALWGVGTIGFWRAKLYIWERIIAFLAGASLVLALPLTDELGFAGVALVFGYHFYRTSKTKVKTCLNNAN